MKPETKAAIDAIYAEALAKHGEVFRDAVDILASVASVYSHAADHCADLADDVRTVGYVAVDRLLVAGNLYHLKSEVCDFATRVIEAAHAGDPKPAGGEPVDEIERILRAMGAYTKGGGSIN